MLELRKHICSYRPETVLIPWIEKTRKYFGIDLQNYSVVLNTNKLSLTAVDFDIILRIIYGWFNMLWMSGMPSY